MILVADDDMFAASKRTKLGLRVIKSFLGLLTMKSNRDAAGLCLLISLPFEQI